MSQGGKPEKERQFCAGFCRWVSGNPESDLAVKRIKCATALDVEYVQQELDVLRAAKSWDYCISSMGCFEEPWTGTDGTLRGIKYYLSMPCAPNLLPSPAAFPRPSRRTFWLAR